MNRANLSREDIIAVETKLLAAQRAGNLELLDQLLHDDLIAMGPGGQMLTKEMDLNAYRSGGVKLEEASIDIEEIRISGDSAVCIVCLTAKGSMMGSPLEGRFRYLRFWKCFGDELKIVGAGIQELS